MADTFSWNLYTDRELHQRCNTYRLNPMKPNPALFCIFLMLLGAGLGYKHDREQRQISFECQWPAVSWLPKHLHHHSHRLQPLGFLLRF